MSKKAYLILENGTVFEGKSFGAEGQAIGEVVFSTSMVGYLETLTDPSNFGQIVVQTFPLIGNYGIVTENFETEKTYAKAYIVREWCQNPSNFRCEGVLDTFLKDNGIIGLYDIDTRQLTKIIRETGVMNGMIVSGQLPENVADEIKNYTIVDAVKNVTCEKTVEYKAEDGKYNVVVMDMGLKNSTKQQLLGRGCNLTVVPATTTAEQIVALKPDGIFISTGPGDPAENTDVIAELKKLMQYKIPTFGVGLGHQLLALSQGAKTVKLKYGHRGANIPAVNTDTRRVHITSQNHGYAVLSSTLPVYATPSFINANDDTCEGVSYTKFPAFSVQFDPDAAKGELHTSYLFDKFTDLIKEVNVNAVK